jgi:signal transduction histidine kinase
MSLRTKLVLGLTALTLVLLVPSLFAASRLGRLRDLAVEGRSGQAAAVAGLGRMQALLAELDRVERSFIATSDPALEQVALANANSLKEAYDRFRSSSYGKVSGDLGAVIAHVATLALQIDQLMRQERVAEATDAFQGMMSLFVEVEYQLAAAADSIDALAREDARRANAMSQAARIQTLLGIAIALAWTIILASVMTHLFTSPLRKLSRGMAHVADGGFEAPADLPYGRADEIGELSTSFATMARRLAELDRTKSEFFGIVSHELKTPLNVIGAYAEILAEDLSDESSEYHRGLIADVSEQTRVMVKLVSRLMDISRLAAGTYQLAPERIGVEDFVTTLRKAWERRAEDRGVTFGVEFSPSAPDTVVMDVDIVREEVLGNLIANALRFTPEGGRIDVDVKGMDGGIVFTVTDTGQGITEEHRDLIFQKHYVVDRTSAVGSGLGLAIAKEMVELHGGLITLEESRPDRGACFVVALPLVPASPALEVPAASLIGARPPARTATFEPDEPVPARPPGQRPRPLEACSESAA